MYRLRTGSWCVQAVVLKVRKEKSVEVVRNLTFVGTS